MTMTGKWHGCHFKNKKYHTKVVEKGQGESVIKYVESGELYVHPGMYVGP